MEEAEIIARADRLQQMAFALLDQLHYHDLWKAQGGTPLLVGSARTGLMVEPNLDFNILMAEDRPDIDACFAVLRALADDTEAFDDVFLHLGSRLTKPQPYISISIGFKHEGEVWGFDNLVFPHHHPEAQYASQTTEAILRLLDDEKRLRILKIKQERLETYGIHQFGGPGPASVEIYRAVFDGSARTLAECENWTARHPREDYYAWLPLNGT